MLVLGRDGLGTGWSALDERINRIDNLNEREERGQLGEGFPKTGRWRKPRRVRPAVASGVDILGTGNHEGKSTLKRAPRRDCRLG